MLSLLNKKEKRTENFFILQPIDFYCHFILPNLGFPDQECQLFDLQVSGR